jgi:hypothetical protein
MTAPNIVNVATITGNTDVLVASTSPTNITSNSSGSGQVYKINSILVSNVTASTLAYITVALYRSSTAYYISYGIPVNGSSTLVLISKSDSIYLTEGDSIQVTANNDNNLHVLCSYEVIS